MFNNYITMIVTLLKELKVLAWPASLGQLSPSFRALVKREGWIFITFPLMGKYS